MCKCPLWSMPWMEVDVDLREERNEFVIMSRQIIAHSRPQFATLSEKTLELCPVILQVARTYLQLELPRVVPLC